MKAPLRPSNEARRLEALRQYDLLDTCPEAALDELARLAAQICATPMALVSLVDEHRQWNKSAEGFPLREIPRDHSFCAHAILETDLFIVPDAQLDERFADNPLVAGEPQIRFYAGIPLHTPAGFKLGTLCVMDRVPRVLDAWQQEALRVLSRQVKAQLDLRSLAREQKRPHSVTTTTDATEVQNTFSTLELFIDSMPHFIGYVDAEQRYQLVNRNYEEWFAQPREKIQGRTLSEMHRPATYAAMEPYIKAVMAGHPTNFEQRIVGRDGNRYCFDVRYVPRRAPDGVVVGYFVLALDVTERMHAVESLRESAERLRLAVRASNIGLWDWNLRTNQVVYSREWKSQIGHAEDEIGNDLSEWESRLHPEDREQVVKEQQRYMAHADGAQETEFRLRHKDGSWRWIHSRGEIFRDVQGLAVRMMGCHIDITERRELEEQFRQTQKMDAIGQLAGGVAHDFNNVLATMMMQVEIALLAENLDDDTRESLEDIKVSTELAAGLTRQLLAFSRRQVMQTRQLDLNNIVTNITRMLQRILGEDVRLELCLYPRPLLIRADAGMLDQVLLNLIVNARDAMPKGGSLAIETGEKFFTEAATVSGRHVYLRVTDTGSGIAPEHRARIFEPFFTTKEPGKGTGIGLATVFGIVKQHNGSIAVESEVGRGTSFQIFLPAMDTPVVPVSEIPAPLPLIMGTETILLVEDEPAVRRLLHAILKRAGYEIVEAPNGPEALHVWEQHREKIQLLLTDIVMPEGVTGFELAARLRAENPKLRVVFTSGYSPDIAGREIILQEGQNFIPKPCSPDKILKTVRQCLDA